MRRRIPARLLLAALSVSSVAAVAPPAPVAEPAAPLADDAVARLEATVEGAAAPTGLSAGEVRSLLRDRFETHERVAVVAGLLDILDELPVLTPLTADPRDESGTAATIDVGSLENVTPVGDLDGDGGVDVVALRIEEADDGTVTNSLAAMRGVDGATLWEMPPSDATWWFPYGTPDLDGDGAADLGIATFAFAEGCDCEGWDEPNGWSETIAQTWTFLSGRTGAVLGQRTRIGESWGISEGEASSELLEDRYSYRYESHSRGVVAPLSFIGDQDGDGMVDLVTTVADLDYEFHYDERDRLGVLRESSEHWSDTGTSVVAVEALDGRVIRDLSHLSTGGFGWAQPMSWNDVPADLLVEVDGDATYRSECAYDPVRREVCTGDVEGSADLTLTVLDAGSLDVRWTRDTDFDADLAELVGWVEVLGADLTGDGVADLLRSGAVLDGADGSRWEPLRDRRIDGYLGDDDRPVLISMTTTYDDELCPTDGTYAQADRLAVERIDGRTGETIATSTHDDGETCESGVIQLAAFPVGDHDGDGLRDVAVGRYSYATDDVSIDVFPATTGGPHSRGITMALYAIGDVDGDGTEDLNLYDPWGGDDELVVSMPGAVTLWSLDGGIVRALGDVDADGRADVLVSRWETEEHEESATYTHWDEVARGVDGHLFWRSAPVTHEYQYVEIVTSEASGSS